LLRGIAEADPMLSIHRLLDHGGLALADVICRHSTGRGHTNEADHHAIVFVRRGCFVRSADGMSNLLDPTQAYCVNPSQQQRYDHPQAHGDDCTSVRLHPAVLAWLWGDDPTLPSDPVPSAPRIDLEHRLLLAAAHRGETADALHERTLWLVAATLAQVDPARVASGRPSTIRTRRALVEAAREALAADPDRSLADLAATLNVSAYHLSRVFHASVGHTIARHRMRLRVRAALERLAAGQQQLAQVATDVGFVDQSHLCRAIRSETGHTPSSLRRALS
jgi:AraC-like DNA-binding protein